MLFEMICESCNIFVCISCTEPNSRQRHAHLSRLSVRPLLGDVVRDNRNISPLLVQDHSELPVELFDLQVDPVLAFKHLTDLPVIHALIQVLN